MISRRRILQAGAFAALAPSVCLAARDRPAPAATDNPAPPAGFGPRSTAEEVTAGLDLAGMTVLVTGATSGIGRETARVLALRGAHVIATSRTQAGGDALRAEVGGRVTVVPLDLADFASVRACAGRMRILAPRLDALVCNAGIVLDGLEQVDGIEKTFVVNHLGHFLLVNELLPRVLAARQGRVVVLGSSDHKRAPAGGIQFEDLSGRGWDARYAHSKLANGLFSLELSRRLRGTAATSNCVTPGHTRTHILRHVGNGYRDDARSVEVGAATPCYAAVHPTMASVSGRFLRDFREAAQSDEQRDEGMARRLWDVSAALVRA